MFEGVLYFFGDSLYHTAVLCKVSLRFASLKKELLYLKLTVGRSAWPGGETEVNCTITLSVP